MITDKETNTLYLSSLLKEKYPQFHQCLAYKLESAGIPINYLKNTKDIWCRDYMPIQTNADSFVQFMYNPSYLRDRKYKALKTTPKDVWEELKLNVHECDIVLDGGNVVKWNDKVIITDRVLRDNADLSEYSIYSGIKTNLGVNELFVIPELKGEMTGHCDGIVRFIDSDRLLLNDFMKIDKYYAQRLKMTLFSSGFYLVEIPNEFEKVENGYSDATGDYINFLEMKGFVLIPAYGSEMDEIVLMKYKEIFKNSIVENIDCREIAKEGGVLNCISWTINS